MNITSWMSTKRNFWEDLSLCASFSRTIQKNQDSVNIIYYQYQLNSNNLLVNKKRKAEKSLKDPDIKKKTKFLINRDTSGNIIFPIQINNSLTLLNTGTICTNPNYHSEHNLFPIGFSSIRVYNSMRTKGFFVLFYYY